MTLPNCDVEFNSSETRPRPTANQPRPIMSNVTKNQVISKITAVMLRIGRTGCSAGDGYVVCDMNMPLWEIVRDLGIESDLWSVSPGHFVTLTPNGLTMLSESIVEFESAQSE